MTKIGFLEKAYARILTHLRPFHPFRVANSTGSFILYLHKVDFVLPPNLRKLLISQVAIATILPLPLIECRAPPTSQEMFLSDIKKIAKHNILSNPKAVEQILSTDFVSSPSSAFNTSGKCDGDSLFEPIDSFTFRSKPGYSLLERYMPGYKKVSRQISEAGSIAYSLQHLWICRGKNRDRLITFSIFEAFGLEPLCVSKKEIALTFPNINFVDEVPPGSTGTWIADVKNGQITKLFFKYHISSCLAEISASDLLK